MCSRNVDMLYGNVAMRSRNIAMCSGSVDMLYGNMCGSIMSNVRKPINFEPPPGGGLKYNGPAHMALLEPDRPDQMGGWGMGPDQTGWGGGLDRSDNRGAEASQKKKPKFRGPFWKYSGQNCPFNP